MIYFAHPINTYNTSIENRVISLIKKQFPNQQILNPNHPSIEKAYKQTGMNVFKNLVNRCDMLICLPFDDGSIGAGKAKEIMWALADKKPCYYIKSVSPFRYETIKNLSGYNVLSVEKTREKLKNK
jgi:hypothetical protein